MNKWKFLIVTEDYEVFGTNDETQANRIAQNTPVIDVERGIELYDDDETEIEPVPDSWSGE